MGLLFDIFATFHPIPPKSIEQNQMITTLQNYKKDCFIVRRPAFLYIVYA